MLMKNRLGTWPMLLSWIFWLSLPVSQILAREDADATFPPEAIEFFEREVRPLLLEQCSSCHSAAVANTKGGLSLDTRAELLQGGDSGEAIVLGKPDESLLVEAIRRESYEMPPEKALSEKARLTLEKWVELGAPWSPERNVPDAGSDWLAQRAASHWAWQALGESTVPVVANDAWSEQPLDRFILARLNQEGVLPAEKADSTTLLRRLSFDLTGLPPSADARPIFGSCP